MSKITQNEKNYDHHVQPPFELDRREDEHSGDWLQRVLFQPLESFDVQNIKSKLLEIEERRNKSKAAFNDACLELEAWANARPAAEHQAAFEGIESKVRAAHEESEKQERLRRHLLRFVEMLGGALSLLSSAAQIFGSGGEACAVTAADSVSQLPASSPTPRPQVLVLDSEPGTEEV